LENKGYRQAGVLKHKKLRAGWEDSPRSSRSRDFLAHSLAQYFEEAPKWGWPTDPFGEYQ
jgi:hypothetical protein